MHCLDCGTKLKDESHQESCDQYFCDACNSYWYKTRRVVVEWKKQETKTKDTVKDMQELITKIDQVTGDWEWQYHRVGTPQRYISDLILKHTTR